MPFFGIMKFFLKNQMSLGIYCSVIIHIHPALKWPSIVQPLVQVEYTMLLTFLHLFLIQHTERCVTLQQPDTSVSTETESSRPILCN